MDWANESNPDIICLQEVRCVENQIPSEIKKLGYHEFYHEAEKKGYSGVAIYTKKQPEKLQAGIDVEWIDNEGRVLTLEFEHFKICSVYAPSGTTGDIRQQFKMQFLDDFMRFSKKLIMNGKPTLFCGDFNICHKSIDIHNPEQNKNTSGFLPEEREWVSAYLDTGLIDVYRSRHEDIPHLYSWWSYRAASKLRNKGWRIDYHMATPEMARRAQEAVIEKDWDISDHAPVTITYDI